VCVRTSGILTATDDDIRPSRFAAVTSAIWPVPLEVSGLESQAEIPRIRDEDPMLFESFKLNPVR
jgi:hypothetical protein